MLDLAVSLPFVYAIVARVIFTIAPGNKGGYSMLVKNPSAIQETPVQSLCQEDTLEKG